MKYALVGTNGVVVAVRDYREELAAGTFNDEASSAVNGKPFLLPLIEAVLPKGERVLSRSYQRDGASMREVLTTEAIPPPVKVLTAEALAEALVKAGRLTREQIDAEKR